MADQPTNGAPTAPPPTAPVAASQPAPAPAVPSDDTLVPVIVDRQTRMEPLSKVRAAYQTQTAAESRLAEANRILQEHRADLDLGRRIKARAASDPEGAIREFTEVVEKHHGRPIRRAAGSSQDDGESGLLPGTNGAPDPRTAAMERQIAELTATLNGITASSRVDAADREIESALDAYPLFRDTQSEVGKRARELAKLSVAGLRSAQPDVAVADLASEVHNRLAAVVTAQVTHVRDTRQDRLATMPAVPTAGGTPEMTAPNPEGWGTRKSLRDGTFQKRLSEFVRGVQSPR